MSFQSIEEPPFRGPSRKAPYAGLVLSAAQFYVSPYGRACENFNFLGKPFCNRASRPLRRLVPGEKIYMPRRSMDEIDTSDLHAPQTRPCEREWLALLGALDPDPEAAAQKYETARSGLIRIFRSRGLGTWAEDLTDRVIDRSARRLVEKASTPEPIHNIVSYMQAVAARVAAEEHRQPRGYSLDEAFDTAGGICADGPLEPEDALLDCLRELVRQLPEPDRTIITEYYQDTKSAKITRRFHLAQGIDLSPGALRVKVFRIRGALRKQLLVLSGQKSPPTVGWQTAGGRG